MYKNINIYMIKKVNILIKIKIVHKIFQKVFFNYFVNGSKLKIINSYVKFNKNLIILLKMFIK